MPPSGGQLVFFMCSLFSGTLAPRLYKTPRQRLRHRLNISSQQLSKCGQNGMLFSRVGFFEEYRKGEFLKGKSDFFFKVEMFGSSRKDSQL